MSIKIKENANDKTINNINNILVTFDKLRYHEIISYNHMQYLIIWIKIDNWKPKKEMTIG